VTQVLATDEQVQTWVADWYRALDQHLPLAGLWNYLVDDGLSFTFPEGTFRGRDGFSKWYEAVTHRFFDEQHTVTSVEVGPWRGAEATTHVAVHWEARMWDPPEAASKWLGFDSKQTWVISVESDGQLRIKSYVVDALDPVPGSASL
jgi:hypothetical protein